MQIKSGGRSADSRQPRPLPDVLRRPVTSLINTQMKLSATFLLFIGILQTGCFHWLGLPFPFSGGIGTTSDGVLAGDAHLIEDGEYYRLYRRSDRSYGTPALVDVVARTAEKVAMTFPGSELAVGDMSADTGGRISGHRSHRSGRDVDFAFFVTDLFGEPISSTPLTRFDRFGIAAREGDEAVLFDTARNWALVEALLEDETADVQWIFVSRGIKALLIEWGIEHAKDIRMVERAVEVLRQPGDSAPHDDHFHLRIYCPATAEGAFCIDTGPLWPWVAEKRIENSRELSEERLVQLALEGL